MATGVSSINTKPACAVLTPHSEVVAADKAVTVAVDLAGVSQRDLEVTFERGVLTVTGRRQVTAHEGGSVLRQEFESAILRRSFTLSETLDADRIDASLKNGVLTLTIPRVERAGPRKVEIRSSQ